jgi:hypothetical protein
MRTNKLFNVLCATAIILSACVNNEQVSPEEDASVSFLSVEQKDLAGIAIEVDCGCDFVHRRG